MVWSRVQSNVLRHSFGYTPANLPLVITAPEKKGYSGEYTAYSREELYAIVQNIKDLSLPEIASEMDVVGEMWKSHW